MTDKNLEKLAEIGEKKLFGDLTISLMEIKQSSAENNFPTEHSNKKIKSYNNLIVTCKNCGLDVSEQENIYVQIISNAENLQKEKITQSLSKLSIQTQYGSEMNKYL